LYLNIPEVAIFASFLINLLKLKLKRPISEIVDNLKDCCDNNTKYGLKMIKKRDKIILFITFNVYFTVLYLIIYEFIFYAIAHLLSNKLKNKCN